jgi:Flp pilus assembly protein TadG
VLVALLIVVLVGLVGVVLDFSRFYVYRTQMQTTVDASALAGAIEVAQLHPTLAPDSALDYVQHDSVDGGIATVPRDSVHPMIWNFSTGSGTLASGWTAPGVNAVTVSASHAAAYTFGSVWIAGNQTLHTTATAAVAYVGSTNCLKPWTVSYQTLLDALYPPAGSRSPSYNLTASDITRLTQMGSANVIPLLLGNTNPVTPGNIAAVQVDSPWSGDASYKAAIAGTCATEQIGPGKWLSTAPGEGSGKTANSLKTFCDANGGTSGGGMNFTCLGAPKVKLALWDINNGQSGNNLQFRVKYVGVFAITSFRKGGGEQVNGYFSSMASSGGISATPGPITEAVLVQ